MKENTGILSDMCKKYPLTDKGPVKADGTPGHNYTETYESNFHDLRDKDLKLLEIGFGGGDSLKLWAEYFKNAEIYCIDNNLSRIEEYGYIDDPRIKIFYGDQSRPESLESACESMGVKQFDIIIDDGSHIEDHILKTFHTLFEKYLSPGGIYFVEDFLNTISFESESISEITYKEELTTIKKINK
jgi:hypothetical protein